MQIENHVMNLLLIEEHASKIALIRRELEATDVHCNLNTIGNGKSAFAYLKQIGPYKDAPVPDLVLFDFSEPDRSCWSLLKKLAFGPSPITSPVVLLTSGASEELLGARYEKQRNAHLFAPVELRSFLNRMKNLRRDRFLDALSLISDLGLITVRLPGSFIQQNKLAMTA